jgi:hypothetical protein
MSDPAQTAGSHQECRQYLDSNHPTISDKSDSSGYSISTNVAAESGNIPPRGLQLPCPYPPTDPLPPSNTLQFNNALSPSSNDLTASFLNAIIPDVPTISRAEMEAMQLSRARRMAKRTRTETACLPCRIKRARCSDVRPCPRCLESDPPDECISTDDGRKKVKQQSMEQHGIPSAHGLGVKQPALTSVVAQSEKSTSSDSGWSLRALPDRFGLQPSPPTPPSQPRLQQTSSLQLPVHLFVAISASASALPHVLDQMPPGPLPPPAPPPRPNPPPPLAPSSSPAPPTRPFAAGDYAGATAQHPAAEAAAQSSRWPPEPARAAPAPPWRPVRLGNVWHA